MISGARNWAFLSVSGARNWPIFTISGSNIEMMWMEVICTQVCKKWQNCVKAVVAIVWTNWVNYCMIYPLNLAETREVWYGYLHNIWCFNRKSKRIGRWSAFILESKEIPISFLSMNFLQSDRISVFKDKIHDVIFHLKDLFIVSFRYSSEWRIFNISDVLVGVYEFHLN